MKKLFFLLCSAGTLLLTSCDDYGKKIAINNKSEIYLKGDSVTEADAKKLGSLLLDQKVFDNKKERSVQLSKEHGTYTVRFVYDKDVFEKDKESVLYSFKVFQWMIADQVFNKAKTAVVLSDDLFKDYQQVGEFSENEKLALLQNESKLNAVADTLSDQFQ